MLLFKKKEHEIRFLITDIKLEYSLYLLLKLIYDFNIHIVILDKSCV